MLFISFFFFFNDTATTEIYTLSLHDALPISLDPSNYPIGLKDTITSGDLPVVWTNARYHMLYMNMGHGDKIRSEEHTSELQSRLHLVCRLLLEKKKNKKYIK